MTTPRRRALSCWWPLALLLAFGAARAGTTDIADVPLFTSSSTAVKPNIMFVLDNSGSMASDYLPDDANFALTKYGKKAAQCNGLAYNPALTYSPPVDAAGNVAANGSLSPLSANPNVRTTSQRTLSTASITVVTSGSITVNFPSSPAPQNSWYANGDIVTVFSSADSARYMEGTVTSWTAGTGTLVVSVSSAVGAGATLTSLRIGDGGVPYYYTYKGAQTALGYTYTSAGVIKTTNFYKECNSAVGATPGSTVFDRVDVSTASADAQNYANWVSYYQTRMDMMKASVSLAFKGIGDRYRVGYSTISEKSAKAGTNFVDVDTFDAGQKTLFYSKLNAASPSGYTPLRGALSKAGQYFANKAPNQTKDPVQYSCQKNFTILSTDGYWNTSAESTTYGPNDLDGTNVGQQDGPPTPNPMRDGADPTSTTVSTWTGTRTQVTQLATTTTTYANATITTSGTYGAGSGSLVTTYTGGSSSGCSGSKQKYTITTTQTDTYPLTLTAVTTADTVATTSYSQTQTVTVTPYTQTVVIVNGATVSDTTVAGAPTVTTTPLSPPPDTVTSTTGVVVSSSTSAGPSAIVVTGPTTSTTSCVSSKPKDTTKSVTPIGPKPTYSTTSTATTLAPKTTGPTSSTVSDDTVNTTKVSTTTTGTTGGAGNTLADVAMYYYTTDLRTTALANCTGALGAGSSVCETTDAGGAKANVLQNMQTFTLGLGVNGTLKFSADYLTNPKNSDYFDLTQGTKKWPNPTVSTGGGDPTNIDDLWHAAVNGRGQYFSAGDPTAVVTSLQAALQKITEIKGSAAAAATSTLQPVDGDNDIFVAQFTSGKWIGDVQKFTIDPSSGEISGTPAWNASGVLDARIAAGTARTVYYFRKGLGNTGTLRPFDYANLVADGHGADFDNFCGKLGAGGSSAPAQCGSMTIAEKVVANAGVNLVSYLLGAANPLYRARTSALGDIINSSPTFVGAPKFRYTENSYTRFARSQASRAGVLYDGPNDGVLHAYHRITGEEKWAYVPSAVLGNLYKLADNDYPYNHQFYVDGSPRVGDVWDGTKWRTILVGGLNKGGRAYYALDVTDPDHPAALWEFADTNLGLTFGNPVITKRKDGTWVVVFGSGYNNVGPGDGNGRLYVVDAISGASLVTPVATYTSGTTPAGTTTTPNGLARINAYVASEIDNTAKVFYGGDLLGNVWRFDIDSNVAPYGKAFLFAQLAVGGVPEPVTTKPEIAEVNYQGSKVTVVYVGTGKYLGTSDLTNTDLQAIYALKDDSSATPLGDVRSRSDLVTQTITTTTNAAGETIRKASTNAVDWSVKKGWRVDLPSTGERVNVNMIMALNVLSVATNVPTSDACDAGGRSWLYKFDIGTGSAVSNATDGAVAISLGNVLVAGQTVVQLADGQTVTITTLSNTAVRTDRQPPPPVVGLLRRTSWRELAN